MPTTFGGGPKTGHKMKAYRNGGSVASPSWAVVSEIGDLSIPDLSIAIAELKRRANSFTKGIPSLFNLFAVEFRLLHGLDKTVFELILDDFWKQRVKEWAICDGDITNIGTYGLRLPVLVEQFPWDQPLEDVSGHDVRLTLAYLEESSTEVDPSWLETGGSPGSH